MSIFIPDLKRLLERPHFIEKKPVTVIKRPPKKKVPLDPLKLHVQGLKEETSEESLLNYLEKFSNVEVTNVYMGHNNNAVAVFVSEPGNNSMILVWICFFRDCSVFIKKFFFSVFLLYCFLRFCCVNLTEKDRIFFFLFQNNFIEHTHEQLAFAKDKLQLNENYNLKLTKKRNLTQ